MTKTIEVEKAQLGNARIVETSDDPLGQGEARLRVESFAVTANNVTYAAIGDMFGYWNFFPASVPGQGVVPVWGHAIVEESRCEGLAKGARVYGYLPMGERFDLLPGEVSSGGFIDMAAHRQPMAAIYNRYSLLEGDPEHDPAREDERMIFGPLFKTGFLIEAMLRREAWFGASALIMTSASSKTALALAHCTRKGSPLIRRIGLTSPANLDFVKATGLFDEVLPYGAYDRLRAVPAVSVDFAGNAQVLRAIHETLGDALQYSCTVGITHVDARGGSGEPMPGPTPTLFFAPDHAANSLQELGPRGFAKAVATRWRGFLEVTDGFMTVDRRTGLEAARDAFIQTLAGRADPAAGIVVRP